MTLSQIFSFVGLAIAIAGHVMFLVATQRVSRGWFLSCLFIPFVGLLFIVFHFPRAWKPLVVELAGIMAMAAGVRLAEQAGFTSH